MLPDLLAPEIKSQAEAKLFHEFRDTQTEERYIILHSLGLSEHVHNIFGEIDFVVICTSGVLCVEVKGGEVSCNNGVWEFVNRYGKKEQKTEGPFQQVQGNMQSLRTYLLKRLGKRDPLVMCQYASCVIMPDCRFTYQGIEIISEILFDKTNYQSLDETVLMSFAYWKGKLQSQYGFEGTGLGEEEMDRLANLLRGDFHFVPSMKDTIDATSKALCALTDEQYDVLESLADNERTLVSGMAGTGKTWLGMEQARRIYWAGHRVLYVCFNKSIAEFVQYQFKKEEIEVDVSTLHSLMLQGKPIEEDTSEFFEQKLPLQFLNSETKFEYDYLIIDEGQDLFRTVYLSCLEKLIKGGLKEGCWLIFYDQNQNLYNSNDQFDSCLAALKRCGAASYKLSVNCRNTKQIADANTLMTGVSNIGRPKVNGLKVQYLPYSDKSDEHKILDDLLLKLKNDGICGGDLIILSKYSITNQNNCLCRNPVTKAVGLMKSSGQMWRAKKTEVRFSTISGFKGLESKAVILTDVDGFSDQQIRMLNYVAVSRASALLYVLYDSHKEQERQMMMVRSYAKL
jgi:hypothetical protein